MITKAPAGDVRTAMDAMDDHRSERWLVLDVGDGGPEGRRPCDAPKAKSRPGNGHVVEVLEGSGGARATRFRTFRERRPPWPASVGTAFGHRAASKGGYRVVSGTWRAGGRLSLLGGLRLWRGVFRLRVPVPPGGRFPR